MDHHSHIVTWDDFSFPSHHISIIPYTCTGLCYGMFMLEQQYDSER